MNSAEIRQKFLDFFVSKSHQIVRSAPMVIKDDPTLMFTNAGMNQFKDIFLGNSPVKYPRIANTQKCLRVSGKHNDLEEVGHDTYHHTMFEMLGNWSFGDYFKKEAIEWAWEFLVDELEIDKNKLYVTIFEGDESDMLEKDEESYEQWKFQLNGDEERIILGNKKDNFWEMGDTGPCGPCSEIHYDLRSDEERKETDGKDLVNKGHPKVIEIWNLVFIQFNRTADGKLIYLENKHVDTGMGFERLCMVLQGKTSNYDTDLFQPIIKEISRLSNNMTYGQSEDTDIAMRVVADHLRAVSFAIADGQLPSNAKAGYVIRRILRRAVRYNYTFLHHSEPVVYKLVAILVKVMGEAFGELIKQKEFIEKVIMEEEQSFLHTLDTGIKLLDQIIADSQKKNTAEISGKIAFELYDTYGFPLDLTALILKENDMCVNMTEFENEMKKQKQRSKNAASLETDDWVNVSEGKNNPEEFVGYENTETDVHIVRYRKVIMKDKAVYHLVFDRTPFYAESGGQIGDTGYITDGSEKIEIVDTVKENNLNIHVTRKLPEHPKANFTAIVNENARKNTAYNHTSTHLLHYALRKVLGTHVEQKGSLVAPDYLRFDFSHYQKVSDDQLEEIESIVNRKIRNNLPAQISYMPLKEAQKLGAMALFGEKYGEVVRVVRFGDSVELCGGTHVRATGEIGFFKIISESAIAAGIRRIEAITGQKFEQYLKDKESTLQHISSTLKNPQDIEKAVQSLLDENAVLQKELEEYRHQRILELKDTLIKKVLKKDNMNIIAEKIVIDSNDSLRNLAYLLKGQVENLYLVLGAELQGKPSLTVMISDNLVNEQKLNAGLIVKEAAKAIKGGGGGQPFYASAGGKDISGIEKAIARAVEFVR